ncbi:MAG: rhodanese-like domain-containing protein [Phaeodactylibacter sp.]|nr:rhodanese-like domain-containing protein [Phaeodactylibacter sp.]
MHALAVKKNYNPVMVDVREPAEYQDLHLYGAVNIPSTKFAIADYEKFRGRPIYLICNTGQRGQLVKARLEAAGFPQVELNDVQMQAYTEQRQNPGIEGSWTVDRQFRLTLGILLLTSLAGLFSGQTPLIAIALIIALGLTITAVIDRCYFKMLIAWMPWNR